MILYGAGGHGKVVADLIKISSSESVLFIDENPNAQIEGFEIFNSASMPYSRNDDVIITIGDNKKRKEIYKDLNVKFGRAIHPFSFVSSSKVVIGQGTVIMAGAIINAYTHIGNHCIINTNSSLDHDCRINDFVHISPGATVCGGVIIGEGSQLGAGSVILPNIKVGKWVVIGAGSTVIQNIPDYAVVVGSPAKIIRFDNIDG